MLENKTPVDWGSFTRLSVILIGCLPKWYPLYSARSYCGEKNKTKQGQTIFIQYQTSASITNPAMFERKTRCKCDQAHWAGRLRWLKQPLFTSVLSRKASRNSVKDCGLMNLSFRRRLQGRNLALRAGVHGFDLPAGGGGVMLWGMCSRHKSGLLIPIKLELNG